ncbi:hypothetical protein F4775DRAFT_594231 [Biscogniauxia sp. FL1348]|nr:hypothetical protein F4775DRAFT_594231 [Biscogniauxia sp. FL1348]
MNANDLDEFGSDVFHDAAGLDLTEGSSEPVYRPNLVSIVTVVVTTSMIETLGPSTAFGTHQSSIGRHRCAERRQSFTISSQAPSAYLPFPRQKLPTQTILKPGRPRPRLSLITDFDTSIPLKMRFQAPQLGALGVTFTALRAMQFASLIAIVGLTSNFIAELASSQRETPDVLIGTLTVASIATLYVAISYILYYDGLLPLLLASGMDTCLLVASIVVAVTIGKPLSLLNCDVLPDPSSSSADEIFTVSISTSRRSALTKYNTYLSLITTDKPHCYEVKAVWGFAIALCVLFAFSGLVCGRAGATSGGTAAVLGTRVLAGTRFPPPLAAPQASHRRPVPAQVPVPMQVPQITITNANTNAGPTVVLDRSAPAESRDHLQIPSPPPPAALAPPPVAAAEGEYIPIMHKPANEEQEKEKPPLRPIIIPSVPKSTSPRYHSNAEEDDDSPFTPVTPLVSPPVREHKTPRNALGIVPVSKFRRVRSMRAIIVGGDGDEDQNDDAADTAPLTPLSPGENGGGKATTKPKRKTFFGVLEGWWDLGLLERGKSLRRRG